MFIDYSGKGQAHALLNTTVQVFGEVMVFKDEPITFNSITSSKELVMYLRDSQIRSEVELGLDQNSVKQLLEDEMRIMKKKYKPLIRVFHIKRSVNAHQAIGINLQLRIARKRKHIKFKYH